MDFPEFILLGIRGAFGCNVEVCPPGLLSPLHRLIQTPAVCGPSLPSVAPVDNVGPSQGSFASLNLARISVSLLPASSGKLLSDISSQPLSCITLAVRVNVNN